MASQLTRDEVAHIADLARLELSPAEQDAMTRELTHILAYAATVQQVDTTGVDASVDVADRADAPPRRADVPVTSLRRDDVVDRAPDAAIDAGLFRVPRVL